MMRLQKYGGCKVVLLFLVLAGCLLTLCVLYYNKEKEATLSDVQSCVKGMLQQEMRTRGDFIQKKMKIRNWRKGEVFRPHPFYVSIKTEQGEERFLMDSLSSMKNIAPTSQERVLHSTSLMESPFRLDSFRMACIDSLAQRGVSVRLFFDFRDREEHITSGDSLSSHPVMDYNIGYANEYSLKAYAHIPFFFKDHVNFLMGATFLFIVLSLFYCYRRLKRVTNVVGQKEELGDKSEAGIRYVCPHKAFYLSGASSVHLTSREAEIFESLYFAPEHTMSSSDLKMKLFGDSSIQTSALATRLGDIRKKLREVGDIRIEYNKTSRCYTLSFPTGCIEVIS